MFCLLQILYVLYNYFVCLFIMNDAILNILLHLTLLVYVFKGGYWFGSVMWFSVRLTDKSVNSPTSFRQPIKW
jgi:hypothetical protein